MDRRRVKQRHVFYSGPVPDDLFNKLPDDTIIDGILPLLDLKERIRSSILSRRWRNLWRYTPTLVFPPHVSNCCNLWRCFFKCIHLATNRIKYANSVTSTLRSFTGPQLDTFTVCYDLDSSLSRVVDSWLRRAIRLGVKKLHLHFGNVRHRERNPDNNYKFPSANYLSRSLRSDLTLGISCLRDISLELVTIAGETVEYLLSSCPLLEFLSLKEASIQYLRIAGPSLKLKYLQVLGCRTLKKLDISAPNLITLYYDGSKEALSLTNIPHLEHLLVSRKYLFLFSDFLLRGAHLHFGYYSHQLKILEFDMTPSCIGLSPLFDLELPMLFKLEEVRVKMHSYSRNVLLWPCCLLKSAPRLKSFAVQHRRPPHIGDSSFSDEEIERITAVMKEATKCKHPCLKVIEFVGVHRALNLQRLASHLVSCAASLEKVVFDTLGKPGEFKEYFNNFRRCMPSDAQLVLL